MNPSTFSLFNVTKLQNNNNNIFCKANKERLVGISLGHVACRGRIAHLFLHICPVLPISSNHYVECIVKKMEMCSFNKSIIMILKNCTFLSSCFCKVKLNTVVLH